jgi:hypothetical protein
MMDGVKAGETYGREDLDVSENEGEKEDAMVGVRCPASM